MVLELRSDRCDHFEVTPQRLWARIAAVDEYRSWWPWLRECDAAVLRSGQVWRCAVQSLIPYRLHFSVTIDVIDPGRSVTASISGDIAGTACFVITPAAPGCAMRMVSALEPRARLLQALTTVARPVAQRSHDWILESGIRQLRENL